MTEKIKISETGQITIPKKIRDELKITSKSPMILTTINSTIILQKETNKDIISYSFLHNQIINLREKIDMQNDLYLEQQQNIITLSIQINQALEKLEQINFKKV